MGREGRGGEKGGAQKVVCPGARPGSRRAWPWTATCVEVTEQSGG